MGWNVNGDGWHRVLQFVPSPLPKLFHAVLEVGGTAYFHSVVTPVIVCPPQAQVIPLVPEFIVPLSGA